MPFPILSGRAPPALRSGRYHNLPRGTAHLPAEEAGPEAAVLQGVQFGFEADPVFGEGGFLLREGHLFLEESFALGLEFRLVLFQGGDRLLLQFALELDQIEAFYLGPETVYLHPGRVALLADLLYLTGALLEPGLVVLALLQEA